MKSRRRVNSTVGLLRIDENNAMKILSRTVLLFVLLPVFGQSEILAQTGCSLVDKTKPLLFISFERLVGKKNSDAQLRLNNNSTCTIVIDTYEEPPKRTLSEIMRDRGICQPSKLLELQDGSHVGMFYSIKLPHRNLTQAFGAGDVITPANLKSGGSILINVPLKYFKDGGELRIHFQYDWEACSPTQDKYVIMYHEISFYPWFIPKDVLK
jgi:hypothetical protein